MKRQTIIMMLALVGLTLMLTSCETTLTPKKGKQVQFSATLKSGMKTKTSYSGVIDNNKIERIDWVPGDKISIISSDGTKVATPSGKQDAVYTISGVTASGHLSNAQLANNSSSGLTWNDDDVEDVTFYGAYPPTEYGFLTLENGKKVIEFKEMTIPANPTLTWDGNTASPDMTHAYMVAAPATYNSQVAEGTSAIHLDFYPLFNAFEIDLASADKTLSLKKLELIADRINNVQTPLTGKLVYDNYMSANGSPSASDVSRLVDNDSYKLSVNLEGKSISKDADGHVHFTVLALPGDITNLTLAVTYVDPVDANKTKTRKLKLQQSGSFITFPAFHKALIKGLALDDGSNWRLTINTAVKDWTFYSKELSSLDQINVAPLEEGQPYTVNVTGAIQTTATWKDAHNGKSNDELPNVEDPQDPTYYARYYQIRTLNLSQDSDKQFFEMSFTPTAPIGGYWQMVPEYIGTNSGKHFRFEVKIDNAMANFEEMTVPHGQIINSKVYVRIYPKDIEQEDDHTYEMIFKCYFSPNANFSPTYSADSELQDVHGDGRFSYWRFRLQKYSDGPYPVTTDDEHESLKPQNP